MSDAPKLRLTIRNAAALENGVPTTLLLAQRNATIGRSPTADWSLPDPRAYISSRHCEISYAMGEYRLADRSTNGTFLNGSAEKMRGPHILCDGDTFQVGHYEIVVAIEGAAATAPEPAPRPEWKGWEAPEPPPAAYDAPPGWGPVPAAPEAPPPSPPPPPPSGWAPAPTAPPPPAPTGGWGPPPFQPPVPTPDPAAWAPPQNFAPAAPPQPAPSAAGGSPWDMPPPPTESASPWSSAEGAGGSAAEDAWGKLASSYAVDWSRGGFEVPPPPAAVPEQGAFVPPSVAPVTAHPAAPPAEPDDRRRAARRSADTALAQFLEAAGLEAALVKGQEPEVMAAAGGLLRRLVAGLVVMMEARARAKSQMGAQTTIFSREGNNPIKFARSPESALAQLLNPPLAGYMASDRAVEDSFRDLQLHQIATLKAMQGALRATLSRFSPEAIRRRATAKGLLKRILPGAREAALWEAYEREFSGVAQGSDEAFMDVFAKEFRKAYDEAAAGL